MPLTRLKEFRNRQAGVYVISPQHPTDDTIMFKIGRTIQMNKRLNGYHLCFPDGFYIYKALMLNDTYKTRLKTDKQTALALTIKLEKFIHTLLEPYRHKSTTRTKHEWFSFTGNLEEIDKALITCHNEFKTETDYPITQFSDKGFYDYFYIDDVEEMKIAKTRLGITEKPPEYMGGEVHIVNKVKIIEGGRSTRVGRQTVRPKKFDDSEYFDLKKKVGKNWK
jgi:hypothetical protein